MIGDGRERGTLTGAERQGEEMVNLNLVHLERVIQVVEFKSPRCQIHSLLCIHESKIILSITKWVISKSNF